MTKCEDCGKKKKIVGLDPWEARDIEYCENCG